LARPARVAEAPARAGRADRGDRRQGSDPAHLGGQGVRRFVLDLPALARVGPRAPLRRRSRGRRDLPIRLRGSRCSARSPQSKPHMTQPDELRSEGRLKWSSGTDTEVWELLRASAVGDLETITRQLAKDPTLARSHYAYRTPLYFAVREN